MVMKTSWIGTPTSQPMYACRAFQDWIADNAGNEDLVNLTKRECRAFASVFVSSVKARFSKIWDYYQALELIDPLGPELAQYATPSVWEAMGDLCHRRGIDLDLFREEVITIRAEAPSLDVESKSLIKTNLCSYLRRRRQTFVRTRTAPRPLCMTRCVNLFFRSRLRPRLSNLFSRRCHIIKTRLETASKTRP